MQTIQRLLPLNAYHFRVGGADGPLKCEARIVSCSADEARRELEDVLAVHNAESGKDSHHKNEQYIRLTFGPQAIAGAELLHRQEMRCDTGSCFEPAVHIDINDNARCQKHHDEARANR
jgi:hypothetical protein